MKIVAHFFSLACMFVSGIAVICGIAIFQEAHGVFQEIAALICFLISANLLVACAAFAAVQCLAGMKPVQPVSEAYRAAILEALHEIRDRGYDTVDRLDRIDEVARQ